MSWPPIRKRRTQLLLHLLLRLGVVLFELVGQLLERFKVFDGGVHFFDFLYAEVGS
jgi:hypothetical protein